ncbi:arylsulfatase G isoform X4 [Danio rerio]|uniref:Arylsulfatase G isoform X4 n=1 Tax=Danio rerio TaxID=7955 RepID=A0AC58GVS5_DANRE
MAQLGFCTLLVFSGLLHHIKSHIKKEDNPEGKERPNFIIILADDIGWGDLWLNRPDNSTPTPWLDSLMLKGKRFTDFHSPASTCSPSRASILTGRHGLRNGVTHNFAVGSVGGLPLNETTFAQLLHDEGYYTAMIGKWHLGHNGSYSPVHRVMTWAALTNQALTFPAVLPVYIVSIVLIRSMRDATPKWDYLCLKMRRLLSNPWTHGALKTDMQQRQSSRFSQPGGGSAKRTTWEGGHRVPTVVSWPKKIKHNSSSDALLSGLDIFPTVLSLAGVKPPSDRRYDGIDITDVLLNDSETGHESLMHPNSGAAGQYGDLQTVRLKHHKAFYITGGSVACDGESGPQQHHDPPLIFDLSQDEAEETPLDPESKEFRSVLKQVEREREALLWDIATDRVSAADYTVIPSAEPCCEPQNPVCRCHRLK